MRIAAARDWNSFLVLYVSFYTFTIFEIVSNLNVFIYFKGKLYIKVVIDIECL